MKKLLLLALISSAQAQNFSGTAFDLETGRMQIISGSIDSLNTKETMLQKYKRMNNELAEFDARLNAESAASQQLYELREQTRLLQKIADK
jgi:hypothetical protein